MKVGLIQTVLPGVKDSVLAKTVAGHRSAAGALGQPGHAPSGARRMTKPPSPRRWPRLPATTTWW